MLTWGTGGRPSFKTAGRHTGAILNAADQETKGRSSKENQMPPVPKSGDWMRESRAEASARHAAPGTWSAPTTPGCGLLRVTDTQR